MELADGIQSMTDLPALCIPDDLVERLEAELCKAGFDAHLQRAREGDGVSHYVECTRERSKVVFSIQSMHRHLPGWQLLVFWRIEDKELFEDLRVCLLAIGGREMPRRNQ